MMLVYVLKKGCTGLEKHGKKIRKILIVASILVQIPLILITYRNSIETFEMESSDTKEVIEHSIQSSLDFVATVAIVVENFNGIDEVYLDNDDFTANLEGTYHAIINDGKTGSITGAGDLPLSEEVLAEMNFIYSLNEYFKKFYDTNSSVTSVYYISENDFMYFYPTIDVMESPYTDSFQTKEYYTSVLPENNPTREAQWSSPYYDYSSGDAMVTLSKPVYDDNEFIGVTAVDFATTELALLLNTQFDSYICDSEEYVLATNIEGIDQEELVTLSDVAGESADEIEQKIDEGNESISYFDGDIVYISPIANTDWSFVATFPVQSLIVENIGIILLFLLISMLLILNHIWSNRKQRAFELEVQKLRLEEEVLEKTKALRATEEAAIDAISALAESRDNETGAHIKRTKLFVEVIATQLSKTEKYKDFISEDRIKEICLVAPLHDIGKVAIPDAILQKPGKLTDEEFEIMKTHTTLGSNALQYAFENLGEEAFLDTAMNIAESHHERWDGSGYPNGLSGESISLSARIVALADVYDALTSERVYKSAMSHEEAKEIIINQNGKHFDPDLVEVFLRAEKEFETIAKDNR